MGQVCQVFSMPDQVYGVQQSHVAAFFNFVCQSADLSLVLVHRSQQRVTAQVVLPQAKREPLAV